MRSRPPAQGHNNAAKRHGRGTGRCKLQAAERSDACTPPGVHAIHVMPWPTFHCIRWRTGRSHSPAGTRPRLLGLPRPPSGAQCAEICPALTQNATRLFSHRHGQGASLRPWLRPLLMAGQPVPGRHACSRAEGMRLTRPLTLNSRLRSMMRVMKPVMPRSAASKMFFGGTAAGCPAACGAASPGCVRRAVDMT